MLVQTPNHDTRPRFCKWNLRVSPEPAPLRERLASHRALHELSLRHNLRRCGHPFNTVVRREQSRLPQHASRSTLAISACMASVVDYPSLGELASHRSAASWKAATMVISTPYLPGTAANIRYQHAPTTSVWTGQGKRPAMTGIVR